MMQSKIVIAFLALLAMSVCGFAQSIPTVLYRLGAEDVVTLSVLRHTEFSGDFVVAPDGTIDIPGAGKVLATNKTVAELQAEIVTRLCERLRAPEVTVTLHFPRMQRIYVVGMVKQPGIYDTKPTWRITEALAAAGGLAPFMSATPTADGLVPGPAPRDYTVTLMRAATNKQLTMPLPDVLAMKEGANLQVEAGDVLTVSAVQLVPIYVMGSVKAPGMFEIRAEQGVREALALAGGLLLPEGDIIITLKRGQEIKPVDLNARMLLQPGDVLMIAPVRSIHVTVTGHVQKPGIYDLKAGESLVAAITQAGGVTDDASLNHVKVSHADGHSEEADVNLTFVAGNAEKQVQLTTGDLVIVPEKLHVTVTGQVQKPGSYSLKVGEGLMAAITQAGGVTEKASLAHVKIIHPGGRTEEVDINSAFLAGTVEQPVVLSSGDLVVVPENNRTIAVLGYVKQPGYFTLREGKNWTLTDVLGLANGPVDQRAGITSVAVLRADATGKQTRMIIDLDNYLRKGDTKQNPLIQPGDVIYVPETKSPNWTVLFQGLEAGALMLSVAKR